MHPAGFTITNTVNAAQEITQIQSSLVDASHPQYLAKNITYTPWGAEATLTNGCASSSGQETGCTDTLETYQYNNRMQPVMIELGNTSNAAADYCLVYNYYAGAANPTSCTMPTSGADNNGDVAGVFYQDNADSSLSHTEAYTYDGVNRLETAVATGNATYNLNFTYDQYGNMQCNQQPSSGLCGQWGVNTSNNQLTNAGYTYDAAGDLTGDGTNTYKYDAEGRLASINSGTTESYVYNALGTKARIVIHNSPNDLFSDPAGAMLGDNGAWSVLWPIAGHAGDIYFQGSDAEFYHADGTHSTRMVTSTAGAVSEQVLFYPWGQVWKNPGWGGWNFAAIQWYDTTGSLNLAPFRDYSFFLGRWMSPDPLGGDITNPQSLNRYAYVENNPTTYVDPLGLNRCDDPFERTGDASCSSGGMIWPPGPIIPPIGIGIGIGVGVGSSGGATSGGGSTTASSGGACGGEPCPPQGLNWELIGGAAAAGGIAAAAAAALAEQAAANVGTANPSTLPPQVAGCEVPVLNAINKVFGTNFSGNFPGTFYNGAANLFVTGTNLTAAQFNAISALGRFPLNPISYLIGYGPTLHITGPGFFDQAAQFSNSNVGGATSVVFTAHIDSAFAYNPIGLLLHLLIDVLDRGAFRAACP